ncbi:GNAT family N-acetyltransferase [Streptococcus sp. DD12]|uniref:GNAT family N-acetyltransferase n=1 Tax=Streptococcus sp. DD12 TaxID=1777880 RepID=UPI0007925C0E|nr:GNAT family protein [Streptococcus sp. DD12]KXT75872.1 Acetyltransferase [Streptococcus sp. DD12]
MAKAQVVDIREALATDSEALLAFMARVQEQTSYISVADWQNFQSDALAHFLAEDCERLGQFCLVACLGKRVIGLCHLSRDQDPMLAHIGDLFLVVDEDFWGQGLGQALLETVIDWAVHTPELAKLCLTVQARNQAAIHIYEKNGFVIEGKHPLGVKTRKGDFLDTYSMGRLIDERR